MPNTETCQNLSIDRLAGILHRVRVSARVFHTGPLAAPARFSDDMEGAGHLHVLRHGKLRLTDHSGIAHDITAPAAILLPRPQPHDLCALNGDADLACATVDLGGTANPLTRALPPILVLPLNDGGQGTQLAAILELLFAEANQRHCGHQVIMDRLAEAAIVHILRQSMDSPSGLGLLAGLAHPQLALALTAMHDNPERDWTLETLADSAGLSRSVFAETFHQVVGQPPGQYLGGWRMLLARAALERGTSLKRVAQQVGYASPAALSRAFSRHFGSSARDLLKAGH